MKVADTPAACVGLLHFMRHLLSQWDYFHSEAGSQTATPVFVRIAVFIAKKQPVLLFLVSLESGLEMYTLSIYKNTRVLVSGDHATQEFLLLQSHVEAVAL
jgi:hypothetical protein